MFLGVSKDGDAVEVHVEVVNDGGEVDIKAENVENTLLRRQNVSAAVVALLEIILRSKISNPYKSTKIIYKI